VPDPADLWVPIQVVIDYAQFLAWLAANPQEVRQVQEKAHEDSEDTREYFAEQLEGKELEGYWEGERELEKMMRMTVVDERSDASLFVMQESKGTDVSYHLNVDTWVGPPYNQIFGPLYLHALKVPLSARAAGGWRPYYRPTYKPWQGMYGLPTPLWRAKSGGFTVFVGNPWHRMEKNPRPLREMGVLRAEVRVWTALSDFLQRYALVRPGVKASQLVGLEVSTGPESRTGMAGQLQLEYHGSWGVAWWWSPDPDDPNGKPMFVPANRAVNFYDWQGW
jgi:hypothetical protein